MYTIKLYTLIAIALSNAHASLDKIKTLPNETIASSF